MIWQASTRQPSVCLQRMRCSLGALLRIEVGSPIPAMLSDVASASAIKQSSNFTKAQDHGQSSPPQEALQACCLGRSASSAAWPWLGAGCRVSWMRNRLKSYTARRQLYICMYTFITIQCINKNTYMYAAPYFIPHVRPSCARVH